VRSGRQAVEEKEENRKDEKKRGETRKKHGLTFGLCSIFSTNKICRTWEKKVQEPVERVTKTQRKEKARNRRKYRTKGKRFETDEQRPSNHHAFNVVAASSSPFVSRSVLFTFCMHLFSLCLHCSSGF
jgi:hypothetical protein